MAVGYALRCSGTLPPGSSTVNSSGPVHNLGLPGTQCPPNRGSRVGLRTRCQGNCMNFSKFTRAIQFPHKKVGKRCLEAVESRSLPPTPPSFSRNLSPVAFDPPPDPHSCARGFAPTHPLSHQLSEKFNSRRFLPFPQKKIHKRCLEAVESRSLPATPQPRSSLTSRAVCGRESRV